MDRTELTLIIASGLFIAIVIGWVLRWIYELLTPPPPPEPVPDSEWAEYAKGCEQERDTAVARLAEVERDLSNRLTQSQAELEAAMDGLRGARQEAQELRERLEETTSG